MANKIQLRRDTAANWSRINPILADGELGLDITHNKLKAGTGSTSWDHLPFLTSDESASLVAGAYAAVLGTDGVLTVPGTVSSTDGVTISTGRGDIQLGVNLEAPGVPTHFHINKAGTNASSMDLIFGDDTDYVKLPAAGGVDITVDNSSHFQFVTPGLLVLPSGSGAITAPSGNDGTTLNITNIEVDGNNNYQVTVTTSAFHGLSDGDKILISGCTTTTELNTHYYYVRAGGNDSFLIYNDPELTDWVDGSLLSPYSVGGNRPLTYDTNFNGHTIAGSESPFGSGYNSIRLNGGGWIETTPSSDFQVGTQDFAVSFWVRQIEYTNNTRLFNFGSWPNEILGMSSEGAGTTYTWLNGNNIPDGSGGITLDTWTHVLITRYLGTISICINANKGNTFSGSAYNLGNMTTVPLTIGGSNAHTALLNGWIRDFKMDVGQGVDPDTFTLPTGPATANAYTKILVVGNDNFADSSGSYMSTGGGLVTPKLQGSEVLLLTQAGNNGSDAGDVVLRSSTTMLKVNGKKDYVAVADMGGEYPINSTGQTTVSLALETENTTITVDASKINIVYINLADGYSGVGAQTVELGYPVRPGMEVTVMNDAGRNVDVVGWDGPPYTMMPYETIKMVSYTHPVYGNYWWVSSSFTW